MKHAMIGAALGAAVGVLAVSFMVRRAAAATGESSPKTLWM